MVCSLNIVVAPPVNTRSFGNKQGVVGVGPVTERDPVSLDCDVNALDVTQPLEGRIGRIGSEFLATSTPTANNLSVFSPFFRSPPDTTSNPRARP